MRIGMILGITTGLAGSLAAIWSYNERTSREVPDARSAPIHAPDSEARTGALEQEVARLRAALERLELSRKFAAASGALAPTLQPALARTDTIERAGTEPLTGDDLVAFSKGTYQAALTAEARDTSWSARRETELVAAFAKTPPAGVTLDGVTCAKTLCRIDFSEGEGFDSMKLPVVMASLQSSASYYTASGDAPGKFVVYLARAGHALPAVDPGDG